MREESISLFGIIRLDRRVHAFYKTYYFGCPINSGNDMLWKMIIFLRALVGELGESWCR